MRRRELIMMLGGAAASVGCPFFAWAQQPALPVVGFLHPNSPDAAAARVAAFLQGLKEAGFVEGQNVAIEYRWAEGHNDRLPALAADLVRRQVKVIVPTAGLATLAAKAATTTIPIVFQTGLDPVKAGFVARLNQPGENITGVTNISTTLAAKRLELMHQLAPNAATIGVLADPAGAPSDTQRMDLQEAANVLGLQLLVLNASTDQEIDAAFATLVQQRIGALLLTDFTFFNDRREQLIALARFNAIPTMYTFREFAAAGGLISYASSVTDAYRRAGTYVARILKGEKPGDLPVQQPTKFELVINLKTAKALGVTIPPGVLAIADGVIE
jgi:putative tryptophan/tyrosine transport system substrate-binding protein